MAKLEWQKDKAKELYFLRRNNTTLMSVEKTLGDNWYYYGMRFNSIGSETFKKLEAAQRAAEKKAKELMKATA
jgi:hypothetical protein